MKTYSELMKLKTYEERVEYLRTDGLPSEVTFDQLRYLNQKFYNSRGWKKVRESVIARDMGFDLAIPGREINGKVFVHHMNPIEPKDLYLGNESVMDPENLITVSHYTHQAIHFGVREPDPLIEREPGDTKLW